MRWRSRWVRAWAGGVVACVGGRFPTLAGVQGRPFRWERRPSTPGGRADWRDGHPSDGPMCGLFAASATCPPRSEWVSLTAERSDFENFFFNLEKRVQPVGSLMRSYDVPGHCIYFGCDFLDSLSRSWWGMAVWCGGKHCALLHLWPCLTA